MSEHKFPSGLFVTGTDTGVGKTVVSALLTAGLGATYWKPIQSGTLEETDTQFVKRVTNLPGKHFREERFTFTQPLSPHASSQIDGHTVKIEKFELPYIRTRHLIVEGAGGLMVPINEKDMIIDLISHFNLPVVLVARSGLGTLNHTLLSIEALKKRNIEIWGVIMNGPLHYNNRLALEKYGDVSVKAEIEHMENIDPESLKKEFKKQFER